MKNTIVVDTRDNYNCTAMDNVAENENTIYIVFYIGDVKWATVEIYTNNVLKKTITDVIPNSVNQIMIPTEYYPDGAGVIKVVFSDSKNVGDPFYFNFPQSHVGNMTLAKIDNFHYTVNFAAPETGDNLADQVQKNTDDISDLQDDLSNLGNDLSGLEGNLTNLQETVDGIDTSSLENDIATLKEEIAALKKIIEESHISVEKLPEDAAEHPDTIYLVQGEVTVT